MESLPSPVSLSYPNSAALVNGPSLTAKCLGLKPDS